MLLEQVLDVTHVPSVEQYWSVAQSASLVHPVDDSQTPLTQTCPLAQSPSPEHEVLLVSHVPVLVSQISPLAQSASLVQLVDDSQTPLTQT